MLVTMVTISITSLFLLRFRTLWATTSTLTDIDVFVSSELTRKTTTEVRSTTPWLQRLETPF